MSLFHPGGEMKLRNKTLIATSTAVIIFLLFSYVYLKNMGHSFISLFFLASLAILFILLMRYIIVIKNIKQLKQDINYILEKKHFDQRIPLKENRQTASLASRFNELLDIIQATTTYFTLKLEKNTEDLKKENLELKQTLSAQKLTEGISDNRECLNRIARYDQLTSLPNRVFFNEILNKAISHAGRRKKILAILLIDIDNFKMLYTQLGKINSDTILKEIGKRFSTILRSEDIIAKLDGDEFIVLLNDIGKPKFASTVSEKLLHACSQPIKINSNDYIITASIGICVYPHDGHSLESLLKNANNALFKAKHLGKNSYQFYTHEMSVEAREYIQLDSALRKATRNNELVLYYQPKFRIKTGSITGLEALMRWEHPVLGIISPSTFIPHAEDSGLINQIGEWALQEACEKAKFWQDEGYEHMTLAIKLSSKQFLHPDIATQIRNVIQRTNFNPKYLELEIDEKALMTNIEETKMILDKIKATGVEIAIDHFGVGYTSISHLKKFPISTIKIDQSFIKGVPNNPDDIAIVTAIISLAHKLGIEVVAEGVETAEQVQFLTSQQCDIIQGYFLGNPVPASKVILQLSKLQDEALI